MAEKASTIVVMDIPDAVSMTISAIATFHNNAVGRREARQTFIEWVCDGLDSTPSNAQVKQYLKDGKVAIAGGYVIMKESS